MTRHNPPLDPRKQPRQSRSKATVAAILEAAAHILERQGLAGFTTNAVAERAGVSIGSLYQYFPSRDAILAALIRDQREALLAALTAADIPPQPDLARFLPAMIGAAVRHWQARPGLVRSLAYAEAFLPMEAETLKLKQRILGVLAGALTRHAVPEPLEAARDLAALTRGMADATGVFGPSDPATLEARILRAVRGYLGQEPALQPGNPAP